MGISIRQHLSALHDRMVEHHTKKAASHEARAGHFKKLAGHFKKTEVTEAEKDAQAILTALAGLHEEMSQEHASMAEFHADGQDKCSKAIDDVDLTKRDSLVPSSVSAVAPDRPNVRAVPRPGQRDIPAGVPMELSKIVGLDEADQHSEETSVQRH
jgi:hypothetical protein